MDEPKQSAARASGFTIPVALVLLLAAYLWPEHAGSTRYSRLLGFQVEGEWFEGAVEVRIVAASLIWNAALFVVAIATFKRVGARTRAFVCGLAALLGIHEILQTVALGVLGDFVIASTLLSAAAGLLLLVAALGTMDRERTAEIRRWEGGRA